MTLLPVLGSAAAICACSVLVGQAVWRLAGFRGWSWLAPPIGLASVVTVCLAGLGLPGGKTTGAVALLVVTLGAIALTARDADGRAVRETVLVLVLGLLAASLPFIAAGRVGILGVTDNADLAAHLLLADSLGTGHDPAALDPSFYKSYPTGPHALTASLHAGLGVPIDAAVNGLLIATLALSVLTALAVLRDAPPLRRVAGALVGGIPYLGAAYAIQSSFKETMLALIAVGWTLSLPAVAGALGSRARAILPLGLLAAGAFGVYSFVALGWLGVATAAYATLTLARGRVLPRLALSWRLALGPALFALVLAIVAIPMAGKAKELTGAVKATAAGQSTGGNLNAELPAYEVFGVWPSSDLRAFGASPTLLRVLAALAAAVAVWSAWWWWRRRRLELPAAALATVAIYGAARIAAKPYYSGKTLAIAAFAVGLMTVAAVVLALPELRRLRSAARLQAAGAAAGVVFLALAAWSSALGLRSGRVAPDEHRAELASLVPLLRGSPTLYMGQNDYLPWILRGVPLAFPYSYVAASQVPFGFRGEKGWLINRGFDFDSLAPDAADQFRFLLTSRTPYASRPPANWRLAHTTRSYEIWERNGPTAPRAILGEGAGPGEMFDCTSPTGQQLVGAGGVAGVLPRPVVAGPGALRDGGGGRLRRGEFRFARIDAGDSAYADVRVPPGRWTVSLQYVSPVAIDVEAGGRSTSVPPSQEGPGVFWRVGDVTAPGDGRLRLRIHAHGAPPLAAFRVVLLGSVALMPADGRAETVPMQRACGRYLDWYRTA